MICKNMEVDVNTVVSDVNAGDAQLREWLNRRQIAVAVFGNDLVGRGERGAYAATHAEAV
jgi:hypothetical protein